jgi:hypothetical protein
MRSIAFLVVCITLICLLCCRCTEAARSREKSKDKSKKKEKPIRIVYRTRKDKKIVKPVAASPTVAPTPAAGSTLLLVETRSLIAGEKLTWSNSFLTNVSSLLPSSFSNKEYDVLSVRQKEFQDINWHSIK